MTTPNDTTTKHCNKCSTDKPLSDFYSRTNKSGSIAYLSWCKPCMNKHNRGPHRYGKMETPVKSETIAHEILRKQGIHTLPGKAVKAADVDLVAWGCVWIEIKYSSLHEGANSPYYMFKASQPQMIRGFVAHIVMLICETPSGDYTYHLFPSDHPVFYKSDGTLKSGTSYHPGTDPRSGRNGAISLTDNIMQEHQDNFALIESVRKNLSAQIANTGEIDISVRHKKKKSA